MMALISTLFEVFFKESESEKSVKNDILKQTNLAVSNRSVKRMLDIQVILKSADETIRWWSSGTNDLKPGYSLKRLSFPDHQNDNEGRHLTRSSMDITDYKHVLKKAISC